MIDKAEAEGIPLVNVHRLARPQNMSGDGRSTTGRPKPGPGPGSHQGTGERERMRPRAVIAKFVYM